MSLPLDPATVAGFHSRSASRQSSPAFATTRKAVHNPPPPATHLETKNIASARTGLPVNITVSRTAAALLDGNTSGQRPNLLPGVPIYAADQNINNWFNPAAFSAPANLAWGNLGRYIANGPGRMRLTRRCRSAFT